MEWRDVVGYKGFYQVNKDGDIMSYHNRVPRLLSPSLAKNGYRVLNLSNKKSIKLHYVHDIVLSVFRGPKPKGMVVNHRDAVKTNNNIDNLEYVTYGENLIHAYENNLNPRCKNSLDDLVVKEVRALIKEGWQQKIIADALSLSYSVISKIKNNCGSYKNVGI